MAGEVGLAYSKDEADLAAMIENTVGLAQKKRQQMGNVAVECARRRYDWEAVVDDYEKLFEDLLHG